MHLMLMHHPWNCQHRFAAAKDHPADTDDMRQFVTRRDRMCRQMQPEITYTATWFLNNLFIKQ